MGRRRDVVPMGVGRREGMRGRKRRRGSSRAIILIPVGMIKMTGCVVRAKRWENPKATV